MSKGLHPEKIRPMDAAGTVIDLLRQNT